MFLSQRDFFTGMGFWTRANPELCLLATRGKPQRRATDVAKLLIAARREHSRKPDETYGRIERLVEGPYLELFARATRPGWDRRGQPGRAVRLRARANPPPPVQRPGHAPRRLTMFGLRARPIIPWDASGARRAVYRR